MAQDCDVNEEEVDAMLAPLMGFLDDKLATLNHNLYQSVFDHVLRVWAIRINLFQAHALAASTRACMQTVHLMSLAGAMGQHLQSCGGHCVSTS